MTDDQFFAFGKKLGDTVRKILHGEVAVIRAEFAERFQAIKDGRDGKDGEPGAAGANGTDGAPGPQGPPGPKGDTGDTGPAGPQGEKGLEGVPGRDGRDGQHGLTGEKGSAGVDGINGTDGRDGVDGKDGLGFDDIEVEFDGERSFTLKFVRGDQVKTFGAFTVPALIYRGVFNEAQPYERGDVVTWGGSMWHAKHATSAKPGQASDESRAGWVMCVRKGSEGKTGPEGKPGKPGPMGPPSGRSS